jgi:hypothetical protein
VSLAQPQQGSTGKELEVFLEADGTSLYAELFAKTAICFLSREAKVMVLSGVHPTNLSGFTLIDACDKRL